jgi:hypothetical protein
LGFRNNELAWSSVGALGGRNCILLKAKSGRSPAGRNQNGILLLQNRTKCRFLFVVAVMEGGVVDYVIGREPDPSQPRIILEDKSVSRTHGKLSVLGNGQFMLEDLRSQNGTYVREKGGWRRIDRAQVRDSDEVRLGLFGTTISELLSRAIYAPGRVRMERNPETGEIVKRREDL